MSMAIILIIFSLFLNMKLIAGPTVNGISGNAQVSIFKAETQDIQYNESALDFSYFRDWHSDSLRRSWIFFLGGGYGQVTAKKYADSFGILRAQSALTFRPTSKSPFRFGPSAAYVYRPGWKEKNLNNASIGVVPVGLLTLFDFSEGNKIRSLSFTIENMIAGNTRENWGARVGLLIGWGNEDTKKIPSFIDSSNKIKNPIFSSSQPKVSTLSSKRLKIRDPMFRFPPKRLTLFPYHEEALKSVSNFFADHSNEWTNIKINHLTRDEEELAKGYRRSANVAQKLIQNGLAYKKIIVGGNYIVSSNFLPNNDSGVELEITLLNEDSEAFLKAYQKHVSREVFTDETKFPGEGAQ